jgi:HPt (histidine-containing phosphotransfer) domain-containing protein
MSDLPSQLAAKIEALWNSSKATVLERLSVLCASQQRLAAKPDDAEARRSGRDAAHKLAGVLGVFGLPPGSELASQIEALLDGDKPLTRENLRMLGELVESLDRAIASKDSQKPKA